MANRQDERPAVVDSLRRPGQGRELRIRDRGCPPLGRVGVCRDEVEAGAWGRAHVGSGQWSVGGCFGADRFFREFLAALLKNCITRSDICQVSDVWRVRTNRPLLTTDRLIDSPYRQATLATRFAVDRTEIFLHN